MKNFAVVFLPLFLLVAHSFKARAQVCYPSGSLRGQNPPEGQCNEEDNSECCAVGRRYTTYRCSPRVFRSTKAILTLNSFEEGGEGGAESKCDNQFHDDDTPIVALSTGWYNGRHRCLRFIVIRANGRNARAKVVDECDSMRGCDSEHAYQPPCRNNIVDGSRAVWRALGIPEDNWGELSITWCDA